MTRQDVRDIEGEIAVVGLGKSGVAATTLLRRAGRRVYASDAGASAAVERAASELRAQGAAVDVGSHDIARIVGAALVVASPGVPPDAAPLAAARNHGVPIVGELEVALQFLKETRLVAITGTNGKTTTTALIAHLLAALGHDTVAAGNIGTPLAELALRPRPPQWIALEVSSFQLHDTPSLAPAVGVLTNLSPDHLDRYPNVEAYYADKKLLFQNATEKSRWILNADDPRSLQMAEGVAGEHLHFSIAQKADAHYDRDDNTLCVFDEPLINRDQLSLVGDHNVANALAAALAVMSAASVHRTGESRRRIADALATFGALAHRLETVAERDGVQWINDSKATNVSSALVAVQGMTRPTILLLGGRHKGEPYTALGEAGRARVKTVIAFGESAPIVESDLRGLLPVERMGNDFAAVMARARELARPGDAVLLSPACSSYDMFRNYEHRGAEFRRLASEGNA